MREEEFFHNLEISEEDKLRAAKALQSKGIEKHILIKEYLLSWCNSASIKYSEVATTYRYDKRIRNVLYKYIGYLEEYYRAIILDNFYNDLEQNFWIEEFCKSIKANENDLNLALESVEFGILIKQIRALPLEFKQKYNLIFDHERKNFYALNNLRNAVMHNKFLILYRGYEICYVKGVNQNKSASLKANILNLINLLPTEVGANCKEDINLCKQERNNQNKTSWDLPKQVIVEI